MVEAKISFNVKRSNGSLATPIWRKVEIENANCLAYGQVMVVMVGDNMYVYCSRCQCYCLADNGGKK